MAHLKTTSGSKGGHAKRELKHIHIEKAGNGFMVHKRYAPSAETMGPTPDEDQPQVFTKHAPAHKFIKSAMAEMHPPAANDNDGDEGTAGPGEMQGGAPPIAPNP